MTITALICVSVFCAQEKSASSQTGGGGKPQTSKARNAASAGIDGKRVKVSGKIRVTGNMPFTEMVITDNDAHDWFVSAEDRLLLEKHDEPYVTVRGTARISDIVLADGAYIGERRHLLNITILK